MGLTLFLTIICFFLGYATSSFNLFTKVLHFFTEFIHLNNPLPLIVVLVVLLGSFYAIFTSLKSIVVAERKRYWEENEGFISAAEEEEMAIGRRSLVLDSLPQAQVRIQSHIESINQIASAQSLT
jgi:hypothetical protein